jgi:DNA polymerase I
MYTNEKTVLIDGDEIAYRTAFACEKEFKWDSDTISLCTSEHDLRTGLDYQIAKAQQETMATKTRVALTSKTNFRFDLLPEYKGNRTARKPLGLNYCKEYLTAEYGAEIHEGIEADDLLGIWACNQKDKIIWAVDKDFLTVPCNLYRNNTVMVITEQDADYNLRIQTLVGDATDNFKGAKGFGEKTAIKWLATFGDSWVSVLKAFKKAGQTTEECVINAKLARILRSFEDINWSPLND